MNLSFRHALPLLALLAGALPAQAQRITSPYHFLDSSQEVAGFVAHVSADRGAAGLGAKSGPAYGLRYAIRLSGPFVIDAEGLYFPSERAVLDTVMVDSAYTQLGTAKQPLAVLTGALRLNLTGGRTWHRILPFVAMGGGFAVETSKDSDALEKAPVDARFAFGTSFAGLLGAGFELFPTDRVSIRVDARNMLWKVKTPAALLRGALGPTLPADEWVSNPTFSAGLAIHF